MASNQSGEAQGRPGSRRDYYARKGAYLPQTVVYRGGWCEARYRAIDATFELTPFHGGSGTLLRHPVVIMDEDTFLREYYSYKPRNMHSVRERRVTKIMEKVEARRIAQAIAAVWYAGWTIGGLVFTGVVIKLAKVLTRMVLG